MKKEVTEFKDILNDLYAITESPCFSDENRNRAQELYHFIRHFKPEPKKPQIVKSGNTWVAYYDGVDYLIIEPKSYNPNYSCDDYLTMIDGYLKDVRYCIPFSEIKLTDEIALLRPMVNFFNTLENEHLIMQLTFIDKDYIQFRGMISCRCLDNEYSLATAKELSE